MIDRVAELNRVMLAVAEATGRLEHVRLQDALELCADTVIEGRIPDHRNNVAHAVRMGLLIRRGQWLSFTSRGRAFVELNGSKMYELTADQKNLIVRTCYLGGVLRDPTRLLFLAFAEDYKRNTFSWSEVDSPPLQENTWVAENLVELGLLERTDSGYEVAPAFVQAVGAFRLEGKGWGEEDFQRYFKEKQEIGAVAEHAVLTFERDRLRKLGCVVESESVRRISTLRVNAGYDVESFEGRENSLHYNRFIEVKGSRGSDVRFFWSQNEMEVARKLGDQYIICFQGGVDLKNAVVKNRPVIFHRPLETIPRDARLRVVPQGMLVEGKVRGDKTSVAFSGIM